MAEVEVRRVGWCFNCNAAVVVRTHPTEAEVAWEQVARDLQSIKVTLTEISTRLDRTTRSLTKLIEEDEHDELRTVTVVRGEYAEAIWERINNPPEPTEAMKALFAEEKEGEHHE